MARALFGGPTHASLWSPDWVVFIGLALVGLGLLCVWLEIGRPLRAINVFFNPRTSWMSREAFVGLLLFPAGLAAMLGVPGWNWITAALALVFLYCQSRMLPAARGIPAWRSGLFSPLFLLTAGCEGLGVFMLLGFFIAPVTGAAVIALVVLLALRVLVWRRYRSDVDASLAAPARRALDLTWQRLSMVGTGVPMVLLLMGSWLNQPLILALAGACAAWAGASLKFTLVTRASYNQGFALSRMPVRGVRTP
jgi:phenylacetyl-CoA:acceptor oxidoreductase subunit 2